MPFVENMIMYLRVRLLNTTLLSNCIKSIGARHDAIGLFFL